MNKYIFLTFEWTTCQPNGDEVENVQLLWVSKGNSKKEAFNNLKLENEWILQTDFNKTYCHELKDDKFDYFYLKNK